ncbi:MFS transporter [Pseudotamlana agarivorans]|uniref:MFS transporter n=1 Tax=Pseudotamlana agarivorans TaxID=481183 RepID=UPI00082DF496|nr:MFS transporter [Tamlana agarivorans]
MKKIKKDNKIVKSDKEKDSIHLRNVLTTVCIALMAVIASVSGLNVAQPDLALDFNTSQNTVLWMINIYTLTLAALLLPLGAVGDRLGRKPVLITGLIIFGIASAAAGFSPSSTVMLVARFFSGVGAAMIMPITLAVITSTFPGEERSKAIGIWTAVAGGGGILGMYLSAVLVDFANWRWLFLLPVVLVGISILMGLKFIPNSKEKNQHTFDYVGSIFSIIATISLVYGLHEAPNLGLLNPIVIASLIIGIGMLIGFVLWESQHKSPLLDFSFFKNSGLSKGTISLLAIFGVQAGIFIVLFPYFQAVLNWSGLKATFGLMPMAVLMMFSSGIAPKLSLAISSRLTIALGVFYSTIGLVLLAVSVSATGGYLSVLPGMIAMGIGMGLSMTPSTEAITNALPENRQGVASALNDLTRELGSALGVALLGALVTAGYSKAVLKKLPDVSTEIKNSASEGIANALAIAPNSGNQSQQIIDAAKQAFVEGWQQAMWVGVIVMLILLVYVLIVKQNEKSIPHSQNEINENNSSIVEISSKTI